MEVPLLIGLGVVTALVVAAIAWFGPRWRQWRTHDLKPTKAAEPFDTLPDQSVTELTEEEADNSEEP